MFPQGLTIAHFSDELRERFAALDKRWASEPFAEEASDSYRLLRQELAAKCHRHRRVPAQLDFKQRREFSILVQFILSNRRLPIESVSIGEMPDFVLTSYGRRIGLELTEAFVPDAKDSTSSKPRGSIRIEQEAIQERVVEEAMELHARAGGEPMRVHMIFNKTNFRQSDISRLAQELSTCIPKTRPSESRIFLRKQGPSQGNQSLPSWLNDVQISLRPHFLCDTARWDVSHGGSVHSAAGVFAAQIALKEKKLPRYREIDCDEYWLLIVIRGDTAASFLTLVDPHKIFRSSFDHVFAFWLYHADGERVVCLNHVKRPGIH